MLAGSVALAAPALPPEQTEFFEKRIRPVLASECYECHGAKKQKGGLRLDTASAALKGGDRGAVITAGKSTSSWRRKAPLPAGGHVPVAVRRLKYAAKSPPKNMISETMKRSIPSTGLPSPLRRPPAPVAPRAPMGCA